MTLSGVYISLTLSWKFLAPKKQSFFTIDSALFHQGVVTIFRGAVRVVMVACIRDFVLPTRE